MSANYPSRSTPEFPAIPEAITHHAEADSFDFRRSWASVKQAVFGHKLLIIMTCVFSVSVVIIYIVVFPPIYQAEVALIGDDEDDAPRDEFYAGWNIFRKDSMGDEVAMMTSGSVLGKVITRLGLTYADVYHPFLSYVGYLWGESWIGKNYRKVKYYFFPKPVGKFILTPEQIEYGRTLHDFKEGVGIQPLPDTNIGLLVVRGPSPRVTQLADTIVDVYFDERKKRLMKEAQRAEDSLLAEMEKARVQLFAHEAEMKDYNSENSLLLAFEKDKVQVSQWMELKAAITELESALASVEQTHREVTRQLKSEEKMVTNSRQFTKNSIRADLRAKSVELEMAVRFMKLRFREDSPEVSELRFQMAEVKKLLNRQKDIEESQSTVVLSGTYEGLRQQKNDLQTQLEGIKANLRVKKAAVEKLGLSVGKIPEKIKSTHQMGREHGILERKYMALQEKLITASLSKATIASAPQAIRVIEYAETPEKPYWPSTKLLLALAVMLGLVLGVLLAMMLDLINGLVNRYQLSLTHDEEIYAIVSTDKAYLAHIYSLPEPAKRELLPSRMVR
jgi:uncharacterized protein involved in exopolysaccharide biosynthesis